MLKTTDFSYHTLPKLFYHSAQLAKELTLHALWFNHDLSSDIQLDLESEQLIQLIKSSTTSVALAYGGHQFGYFSLLGDGRAMLIAQQQSASGQIYDLHIKGSGPTVYARGGDGRAPLSAVLKEALIGEALHALSIPSARTLALFDTHEMIERYGIEAGGLICRVAKSHVRVGTFQYAYVHHHVKELLEYSITLHYPALLSELNPAEAFLHMVIKQQAQLIAQWQAVGFIHGVMNSDNMSILSESIDFGPCAFMESYQPNACYSSIDHQRRYSFQNQARAGLDNLTHLAQTLLSEISSDSQEAMHKASALLDTFMPQYELAYHTHLCKKMGLDHYDANLIPLIKQFLLILQVNQWDYTHAFVDLSYPDFDVSFSHHDAYQRIKQDIDAYCLSQGYDLNTLVMNRQKTNPIIVARPQKLKRIIDDAIDSHDYQNYFEFLTALKDPYHPKYLKHPFFEAEAFNPLFVTNCGT
jgi:serine/tyrosine/threonine adenylyltransferase